MQIKTPCCNAIISTHDIFKYTKIVRVCPSCNTGWNIVISRYQRSIYGTEIEWCKK